MPDLQAELEAAHEHLKRAAEMAPPAPGSSYEAQMLCLGALIKAVSLLSTKTMEDDTVLATAILKLTQVIRSLNCTCHPVDATRTEHLPGCPLHKQESDAS